MADFMISQIQSQSGLGLLCLIAVFFYVGLITIGGGQVAITVMQQVLVDQFHLIDDAFFFNMVAISESTPGPIGINIATYIGTELYGVWGGFFSTLGEVLPSIICIVLIARFFGFVQRNSRKIRDCGCGGENHHHRAFCRARGIFAFISRNLEREHSNLWRERDFLLPVPADSF